MTKLARYLVPFDTDTQPALAYDTVVVGSGVAGLWTALHAAEHGRVALVTKDVLREGSTPYAQGGIAAALCPEDSPEYHLADTLAAGAGLCDDESVAVLVHEGPGCVLKLIELGARFDTENGKLLLGREGAHGVRRIVHALGDSTGFEVARALALRLESSAVDIYEHTFACDLLVRDGRCHGLVALDTRAEEMVTFWANAVVLAAGGAGQLFSVTTNPSVCTGDGMAIAYRAGAELADMEMVQFHPTAFAVPVTPKFLISEAVRGEGAILRNIHHERFMPKYAKEAELASRDIVSRAILEEMRQTHSEKVFLDLTHHPADVIQRRFPKIYQTCLDHGVDPAVEGIPVNPAAHFMMGGVRTDLNAATSIGRLYACGEAACTGVHGANRLASNSLLEGLVFGKRTALAVRQFDGTKIEKPRFQCGDPGGISRADVRALRESLQRTNWDNVGIVRSAGQLQSAVAEITDLAQHARVPTHTREALEFLNLITVSLLVCHTASVREESRGAHYRSDFPDRNDAKFLCRHVLRAVTGDGEIEIKPALSTAPLRYSDDK